MTNYLVGALFCLSLSLTAASATELPDPGQRVWSDRLEFVGVAVEEPGYHVWGSSAVIGLEGKTHLFVSRWPITAGFGAWLTDCEVARYIGDRPEGPFTFCEVVLKGSGRETWDRGSPHNPTVHKVGDQYVLLYIANQGGNKKQRVASQRIGMVVADRPEGPWKKVGADGLILSIPEEPTVWSYGSTVGVNNPALLLHPDGRFFLYYKAMKLGDVRRMGVAVADNLEGPYVFHKDPLTSNRSEIEDGYAFVENGTICLLTTNNHAGTGYLWTSEDGIHFDEPLVGFEKIEKYVSPDLLKDATTHRGKKFERPQVLLQNGKPTHLYVASGVNLRGGRGTCSCVLRVHEGSSRSNVRSGE
ncbi:glycoside hydrolase family protein [Pirellulimonas nuda]|uniref:glycoside hydrolase family protein n=1 Tax=Pirellulimonas nuda TaxID=2528009 RepID=UPI00119D48E4|nr:glycoside hydrolase family protein [Pirellulimonas nuda]